jgi:hypothetical protein
MEIITNRDIEYSNVDAGKAALATAGIGAAAALGSGLLSRQKTLSEVEQKCGKRPAFKGKKRDAWQKCVDKANQPTSAQMPTINTQGNSKKPMNKNLKLGLIIGGSLLGVALIGLVIYKMKKK